MHYKNGREAKENDPVIYRGYDGVHAGTINQLKAGTSTCNAVVHRAVIGGVYGDVVTVSDCVHAEDALVAVETNINAG